MTCKDYLFRWLQIRYDRNDRDINIRDWPRAIGYIGKTYDKWYVEETIAKAWARLRADGIVDAPATKIDYQGRRAGREIEWYMRGIADASSPA